MFTIRVCTLCVIAVSHACRALGDVDHKVPRRLVEAEPDVARIVLLPQRDAFLVLGSDGLFDVLSVIQVVQVAQHALHGSTIGGEQRLVADFS